MRNGAPKMAREKQSKALGRSDPMAKKKSDSVYRVVDVTLAAARAFGFSGLGQVAVNASK